MRGPRRQRWPLWAVPLLAAALAAGAPARAQQGGEAGPPTGEPSVVPLSREGTGEGTGQVEPGEPGEPGASAAAPGPGGIIQSVVIHCDLPRCQSEDEMARLYALVDLDVGKPYHEQDARAAEYYLQQTGLFVPHGVQATATAAPAGGVDVTIDTQGATFIRHVDIQAGLSLEREIEQRIFMRSGEAYDPSRSQQQIDSIRAYFERDGYYDARVDLVTIEVEPYLVDLQVIVDKGQRLDVRDVYLRGHTVFSYDDLRSDLLSGFGFFRTYTEANFEEGVNAILDRYREAGYLRARVIRHEAVPRRDLGVVDLFVEIREGPRWTFEFTGNHHFSDDELLDALGFRTSGFLDEATVNASTDEIVALYRTAGYLFASVSVRQNYLGTNEVRVRYTIYEGAQAEIRDIAFEGNEHIDADTLQGLMATRVYGVLESGGYLQPAQLEGDIRAIEDYYHQQGFLSAFVPRWVVVGEDEGRSLYIRIFIDEGVQTHVAEVRFRGNTLLSDRALQRGLQLRPGEPLSLLQLRTDESLVRSRFLEIGHQPRKLEAVCLQGDQQVPCAAPSLPAACLQLNPEACTEERRGDRLIRECPRLTETLGCEPGNGITSESVTIEYRVAEGSLVTVGEVFVIGNFATDTGVIVHDLPFREGDPYNPNAVLEGQSNLRRLGVFNSVRVNTIGVGDQVEYPRNQAAVVIHVEEAPSQFLEYRLGVASQSRADSEFRVVLENELGYIDQNFIGRALQLQLIGSFDFDLVGAARIADGEFAASLAAIYADPRFDWFNTVQHPWEAQTQVSYTYDLLSTTLHEKLLAGEALIRQNFTSVRGLFFSLSAAITRAQTRTPAAEAFDDRLILRLTPSLILDRRDNPISPTRGYRAELVVDLADKFFGAGLDTEEYTRIRLSGSALLPFARHFVLASWLRFGFALGGIFNGFQIPSTTSTDPEAALVLPPSERFRLGGLSGVRGFPDNSLGPVGLTGEPLFGDIVLNGTLELRFPLLPSIDLYGATFLDAGQLVADFVDFSADGFRYSTGLGVRWLAFGLVPVVFDYGMILDRRVGERIGSLQFNVGYSF